MSTSLLLIAGKGAYPLELARSARKQGVESIQGIAFKGETARDIETVCDAVTWINVGLLESFRDAAKSCGATQAVMAGQITPSNLFHARLDKAMQELLQSLPKRNADTIFGAIADELQKVGVELLSAHRFLEFCRVPAGVLTSRAPTEQEQADIRQGMELAMTCAKFQAGQSVAIKEGTVIAVEGFEGTDRMIKRAGKLAGEGCVVVKAAQKDHDQRWDIPIVGTTTLKSLKKAKCACLAFEANQVILLEKELVVQLAEEAGISLLSVEPE